MGARHKYPSVRHLVCVAGPPCSGKTHALKALQKGSSEELSSLIPIDIKGWKAFAPGWVPASCPEVLDKALFHYDFLRVWKFGGKGGQFEKDTVLKVFEGCERIDFVTLATSVDNLQNRFAQRSMSRMLKKTRGRPHALMNLMICFFRLRRLYRDPDLLHGLYDDWMAYTESLGMTHTLIDSTSSHRPIDSTFLRSILAGGRNPGEVPLVEDEPQKVLA